MSDLISREALYESFYKRYLDYSQKSGFANLEGKVEIGIGWKSLAVVVKQLADEVKTAPAVDAVEVVHGRWIEEHRQTLIPVEYDKDGEPILHDVKFYRCNLCGRTEGKKEPFCNCGARMDGDSNDP